jgi:hypothetical protein
MKQDGSMLMSGSLTASLQEGYTWVGNASGVTEAVATSSFGGGGSVDTSSLATTGSNSFEGNQSVNGDVLVTGSVLLNSGSLSGSVISNLTDTYDGVPEVDYIITLTSASYAELVVSASTDPNTLYVVTGDDVLTTSTFNAFTASADSRLDSLESATSSQEALNTTFATTGSNTFEGEQTINGTFTASLEEGYAWVGDSTGTTVAVATSSFGGGGSTEGLATTGSNTFEGNQTIYGDLEVRGDSGNESLDTARLTVGNGIPGIGHIIEFLQEGSPESLPNPETSRYKFAISGSDAGNITVWFSNGFNWQKMALIQNSVESLLLIGDQNDTTARQLYSVIGTGLPIYTLDGCNTPFWIRPLDGSGYPIFNLTGSVTLEIGGPDSGSGALSGSATESITNNFSSVEFNVGIDTAGTYELTASFAGQTLVTSPIYIVDAPTAIGFINEPPSSVVVGNSFNFIVGWDHPSGSLGQVYTPEDVTVTLTGTDAGTGTLAGITSGSVTGCTPTINFQDNGISISPTGTYTITVTGVTTSLTVESNTITVTAE